MASKDAILSVFVNQCSELSDEIMPQCGSVYELYQRRLSTGIDALLNTIPAEYREEAQELAREEFDYLTAKEIAEEVRRDSELGICSHGIDRNCCPLGCGDVE